MTDTTHEPTEFVDETPRAIPEAGLLGKLLDRISDAFAVAILASASILIIEVFLRYVFNAPTIWGHETVVFLTAVSFLFGGLFLALCDTLTRVLSGWASGAELPVGVLTALLGGPFFIILLLNRKGGVEL